jgi:hypothetical protein
MQFFAAHQECMLMRHRLVRVATVTILVLCVCGCSAESGAPSLSPSATESTTSSASAGFADVYHAVLPVHPGLGSGQLIVVVDQTAAPTFCEVGRGVRDEWQQAIEGYRAANAVPTTIASGQSLGLPYVTIDSQRVRDYFATLAGWSRFREDYPSGVLVTLSAVGFDPARTRAVVYVAAQCGSLCGEFRDYYLQRQGDRWTVLTERSCHAVS